MGHLVGFPVTLGDFKVDGEGEDGLFRYSHQIGALLFGLLAAGVQLPAIGVIGNLRKLEKTKTEGKSAALVMNANPFTLGHQYLAENAAAACDILHLFVVSEDASLVPFAVRKWLAAEGVKHLPLYHYSMGRSFRSDVGGCPQQAY